MAISTPLDIGSILTSSSSSTQALTTTRAVSGGAKVWVWVSWTVSPASSVTLSSVSDGTTTFTIDHQGTNGNFTYFAICSADKAAGLAAGATITATFGGNVTNRGIAAAFSNGVKTGATTYTAVAQNQSSNTAWSSTNSAAVTSGDILIGGSHWEDSTTTSNTPSGGNTELHDVTGTGFAFTTCYQIGAGGAIAASGTWANTSAAGVGCRSAAIAYPAAAAANMEHVAMPPYT